MTLQGNPCAKIKGYRQFLVDNMPQLRSLDEFIVMDFERQDIATLYPPENIKKNKLVELNRFRPFNKETTSWRSTPFAMPIKEISGPKVDKIDSDSEAESSEKSLHTTAFNENFKLIADSKGILAHLA